MKKRGYRTVVNKLQGGEDAEIVSWELDRT